MHDGNFSWSLLHTISKLLNVISSSIHSNKHKGGSNLHTELNISLVIDGKCKGFFSPPQGKKAFYKIIAYSGPFFLFTDALLLLYVVKLAIRMHSPQSKNAAFKVSKSPRGYTK